MRCWAVLLGALAACSSPVEAPEHTTLTVLREELRPPFLTSVALFEQAFIAGTGPLGSGFEPDGALYYIKETTGGLDIEQRFLSEPAKMVALSAATGILLRHDGSFEIWDFSTARPQAPVARGQLAVGTLDLGAPLAARAGLGYFVIDDQLVEIDARDRTSPTVQVIAPVPPHMLLSLSAELLATVDPVGVVTIYRISHQGLTMLFRRTMGAARILQILAGDNQVVVRNEDNKGQVMTVNPASPFGADVLHLGEAFNASDLLGPFGSFLINPSASRGLLRLDRFGPVPASSMEGAPLSSGAWDRAGTLADRVAFVDRGTLYLLRNTDSYPAVLSSVGLLWSLRPVANAFFAQSSFGITVYDAEMLEAAPSARRPVLHRQVDEVLAIIDEGRAGAFPEVARFKVGLGVVALLPDLDRRRPIPLQGPDPLATGVTVPRGFDHSECRLFAEVRSATGSPERWRAVGRIDSCDPQGVKLALVETHRELGAPLSILDHGPWLSVGERQNTGRFRTRLLDSVSLAQLASVETSSVPRAAATDGRAWAYAVSEEALDVLELGRAPRRVTLDTPEGYEILALRWPYLYLGAGPGRAELWSLNLHNDAIEDRIPLASHLLSLGFREDRAYVTRVDGISTLSVAR